MIKNKLMIAILPICFLLFSNDVFSKNVHVNGYFKKNGTYVSPHYRSSPDHNFYNNWSAKGNINPYTGKAGTLNNPQNDYNQRSYPLDTYKKREAQSYNYKNIPKNQNQNQNQNQDEELIFDKSDL